MSFKKEYEEFVENVEEAAELLAQGILESLQESDIPLPFILTVPAKLQELCEELAKQEMERLMEENPEGVALAMQAAGELH